MKNSQTNSKPIARACDFCVNGVTEIDYKSTPILQRFTSSYSKIVPRRRSGVCAKHQRKLANAIKRARTMALLSYTPGQ